MSIRHLIAFVLVLGLAATGAMAASYTAYVTSETHGTGTTTYDAKAGGQALIYGGSTTATVREECGYFKFDISAIPDTTVASEVEFHFYVNATNWPYWSVTPLSLDPNQIGSTAAAIWDDIEAEALAGYYNYQSESSTYGPGWKMLVLGGTATADITAALSATQDWFALGGVSRDSTPTYFLAVDGNTTTNVPYIVVSDDPLPPSGVTCTQNGADVDLTWVNNGAYDSISIYDGMTLIDDTVAGSATSYTVLGVASGPHSYTVCGVVSGTEYCSDPCDIYIGTCDDALVDLGTLTCGTPLTATGDTTGAPDFCGNLSGDAHFSFTVTEARDYIMSLCDGGTTYDSYLRLYDDACCGNEIAFNDDFCGLQSQIQASLTAGTYYVHVEGYSTAEGPYSLAISCVVLPPSGLTCTENGADVDLTWTNNDTYTAIDVYQDGVLVDTLAGTATSYTVLGVTKGGHCYQVVADTTAASEPCCLVFGYDDYDVLWDFEADDGGFTTEGTTGWQWGAPTYGPCFDTADGNVWATNLDGTYANASCFVLESPVITEMGDKGGYICIDHCYDTEETYDGGVVWFTTDDYWYYGTPPLAGYDGTILATGCNFVYGFDGFTGSSGGWVTDCWEVTDQDYIDYGVRMVLAFGSDGTGNASGWMVDNVAMYRNIDDGTIDCDYTITPLVGTVPFGTTHRITLYNLLSGGAVYTRRVAGRIAVTIASGTTFNPWRAGYTNIAPGGNYFTQFPVNIPSLATVIGSNTFALTAMDVTPSPYNQPPYPPSGQICTKTNVVVANAP